MANISEILRGGAHIWVEGCLIPKSLMQARTKKRLPETSLLVSIYFIAISVFSVIKWISLSTREKGEIIIGVQ